MATKTTVTIYNNVTEGLRTGVFARLTIPLKGMMSLHSQHPNHLKKARILCYYASKLRWKDKKKTVRAWGSAPEWWRCTPAEWTELITANGEKNSVTIEFWKKNGQTCWGLQNMELAFRGSNNTIGSGLYLKSRKLTRDGFSKIWNGASHVDGISDRGVRMWRKKLRLDSQPRCSVFQSSPIIAILGECTLEADKGFSTRTAAKIITATVGEKCSHQRIHRIRQKEFASCNHKNHQQCENALLAAIQEWL